jgi:hypothetical protein
VDLKLFNLKLLADQFKVHFWIKVFFLFVVTVLTIFFSENLVIKLFSSVVILFWFFLLHYLALLAPQNFKFAHKVLAMISSMICILPFYQYRYIVSDNEAHESIKSRFFPPIDVVAYSMKNFWNLKRVFHFITDKKRRFHIIGNIVVMNIFFLILTPNVPHFWRHYILGYLLFLVMADQLLKRKN